MANITTTATASAEEKNDIDEINKNIDQIFFNISTIYTKEIIDVIFYILQLLKTETNIHIINNYIDGKTYYPHIHFMICNKENENWELKVRTINIVCNFCFFISLRYMHYFGISLRYRIWSLIIFNDKRFWHN